MANTWLTVCAGAPTGGEAVRHGLGLPLVVDGEHADGVLGQRGQVGQQPGGDGADVHLCTQTHPLR